MRKSGSNFDIDALEFAFIKENYDKFCEGINSLKSYELEDQLTENVSAQYDKCFKLFQQSELRFKKQFNEQTQLDVSDDDLIDPSDSASQVTKTSLTSNTSSALRRIKLERKKPELSNLEEISRIRKANLLAQAKAEAQAAKAEAQAAKAETEAAKAEAEEAEALAKLRIERANTEAEEEMLECCSQRGSQISSAFKMQAYSRSGLSMINGNRTGVKATTFKPKSDVNDIKSPFIESRAPKLETAVKTDGCGRSRVGTAFASTSEGFEDKNVEVNPQFSVTRPGAQADLLKRKYTNL